MKDENLQKIRKICWKKIFPFYIYFDAQGNSITFEFKHLFGKAHRIIIGLEKTEK